VIQQSTTVDATNQQLSELAESRINPGVVSIDSCAIVSPKAGTIDITSMVIETMLYEDVMSPFITGSITVLDAAGLSVALPLMGEELLYLSITTPGHTGPEYTRSGAYAIYKMEARENFKTKALAYKLCFTSVETIADLNQRISMTYRGKVSDLAQRIITSHPGLDTTKQAIVEPTTNSEMHTSNFWTPTQNLYYLASRALNDINNPSYVFFENNEGFVFASLDSLSVAPITYQFIKDSSPIRNPSNPKERGQSLDLAYKAVLDMSTPVMYDYIDRVTSGFYGSSVYHFDVETKRLNYKNFIAYDQLKKPKLNPSFLASDRLQFKPEAAMSLSIIHRNLYTGSPNVTADHHNRRMALLKQITAMTTNIRVYGKVNYSVGNVVSLLAYKDAPAVKSDTSDADVDNVISGNYLITAISHEITREAHYCNIELSKDSVLKDINKAFGNE
jgi:hypothetical protein